MADDKPATQDPDHPKVAAKLEAETTAQQALAVKYEAEAAKALADAETARQTTAEIEYRNRRNRIAAETAEEERLEDLAQNHHHRVYIFRASVNESATANCIHQLQTWHRLYPGEPMEIVFTSPGGSVVDGMALYDFIQTLRSDGHHITTTALGMAASMAGVLLQAGDTRVMGRESWLLIHEACTDPEARILTSDLRWVRAGDLAEGDSLLAFDENQQTPGKGYGRCWRHSKVLKAGRAILPCSRVTLEDGSSLVVSDNHPWLVQGMGIDWRETRNFYEYPSEYHPAKGRVPTRALKIADVVDPSPWREDGYIGGLLDGEGSLGRRPGIRMTFAQNEGPVLDSFIAWATQNGFSIKEQRDRKCVHVSVLGGHREISRFLMLTRPQRLLAKYAQAIEGMQIGQASDRVKVVSIEPLGQREVVTLGTSTRTFVAEGFAMHNSFGAMGKVGEVEDMVEWVKKVGDRILGIFAERSNLSKRQIAAKWKRKDWWLDSEESLKYGFVDEVR